MVVSETIFEVSVLRSLRELRAHLTCRVVAVTSEINLFIADQLRIFCGFCLSSDVLNVVLSSRKVYTEKCTFSSLLTSRDFSVVPIPVNGQL